MLRVVKAWTIVLAVGWAASSVRAGEPSLLGLPEPRDSDKPGAVLLHGGGPLSDDVFERFVTEAGGRQARLVLIPSAGWRRADFDEERDLLNVLERRFSSWIALPRAGRAASFQFVYTDDPDDANDPQFVRAIEQATGVWFSGGAQPRLNYRFVDYPEPTRFQQALRGVVERGGVVGGTSAGMAALPEVMTLWESRNHSQARADAVAAHGLGLFDRAIVEQHFDARGGRLERFTGLLRDSDRLDRLSRRPHAGRQMVGLAVEECGALFARHNQLEVLGTGHVHVFLKSAAGRTVTWHDLRPGDAAELKPSADLKEGVAAEELTLAQH